MFCTFHPPWFDHPNVTSWRVHNTHNTHRRAVWKFRGHTLWRCDDGFSFRSTSLGKRCTSYNAPPTSRKRAADRWSLRNFLPRSSIFMVGKAQKSHGARSGLYGSVGIALGHGLDDRDSRVRFPARAGNSSLHHRLRNGSGFQTASCLMGTRGSFPGGNVAGAWSWPLTSI
jgi:hypothetical protein